MIAPLLMDECLSPELVQLAINAGHVESSCVRDRGRSGLKDWQLMEYAIEEDFRLVTRNAQDFRGAGPANPGGLHAVAEVHAGLICMDSTLKLDFDLQYML
jgi:hypothetical protein